MKAYIIHDAARTEREPYVEAIQRLVPDLEVVQPILHEKPMVSCTLTHKYVLERYQQACTQKKPELCAAWVMEDDIKLTDAFDLAYWYELMKWLTISPYHLLVGGAATTSGDRRIGRNLAEVSNFSSTHCYALRGDVIPTVLAQPAEQHFDGLLTRAPIRKVVTVPFMATQWPGHSAIRNRAVDDLPTFQKAEDILLRIVRD